jgi:hypothetical protein
VNAPDPPESRTLLRYWWAPAAFASVLLVILLGIGLLADGWRGVFSAEALPGIGKLFAFLLAIAYFCGAAGFVGQAWSDRGKRRAATGAAMRTEAGVAARELALLHDRSATAALRAAVNAARRREAAWATVLVPVAAVIFGLGLSHELGDLATLLDLGATGEGAMLLAAWALAIAASVVIWWLTVGALRRGVTLVHVTVRGSEGPDVEGFRDAAANLTGVSTTAMTVRVHGEWKVTAKGLEPVTHPAERVLSRARRFAGTVGEGEDAVLICSGGTMIGRLAGHQR